MIHELIHFRSVWLVALMLVTLVAAGCSGNGAETPPPPAPPTVTATTAAVPSDTPLPPTPTSTPEPLAALVNGEPISLEEYQAELARYMVAAGVIDPDDTARQQVLDQLIDEHLLAQGAQAASFELSADALQARLDDLMAQAGGLQAFTDWMDANEYNDLSFRQALARSISAAWMRDQIIAGAPPAAEQVHARQILVFSLENAQNILSQLNTGSNFATIAAQVDPITLGELGWFPRGYLLEPAIEAAAFALDPGEHSEIIESRLGFHIIQVIERQDARPLEPDALQALRRLAVVDWLAERRSQSQIEIILP